MAGNTAVVMALRRLRRAPAHYPLASLAAADLLVGTFVLPLAAARELFVFRLSEYYFFNNSTDFIKSKKILKKCPYQLCTNVCNQRKLLVHLIINNDYIGFDNFIKRSFCTKGNWICIRVSKGHLPVTYEQ